METDDRVMRVRTYRCYDDVSLLAAVEAERRGETVSDAIRNFLDRYGRGED